MIKIISFVLLVNGVASDPRIDGHCSCFIKDSQGSTEICEWNSNNNSIQVFRKRTQNDPVSDNKKVFLKRSVEIGCFQK